MRFSATHAQLEVADALLASSIGGDQDVFLREIAPQMIPFASSDAVTFLSHLGSDAGEAFNAWEKDHELHFDIEDAFMIWFLSPPNNAGASLPDPRIVSVLASAWSCLRFRSESQSWGRFRPHEYGLPLLWSNLAAKESPGRKLIPALFRGCRDIERRHGALKSEGTNWDPRLGASPDESWLMYEIATSMGTRRGSCAAGLALELIIGSAGGESMLRRYASAVFDIASSSTSSDPFRP